MVAGGWWDGTVKVMLGRNGSTLHHVTNNYQAADILLHKWPTKGGAKQRAAREAVVKAMERAHDRMALAKAQKAFAEAAKEADILVD
ncbi:DUF982 domain-containing protein [Mesorhizobium yinganensis]|uniref:DUF982 domain-containing protein n=1 Tax=Mesorhizobium yinganensis TaxID=3157707 RepID=UPI0032B73AAC